MNKLCVGDMKKQTSLHTFLRLTQLDSSRPKITNTKVAPPTQKHKLQIISNKVKTSQKLQN